MMLSKEDIRKKRIKPKIKTFQSEHLGGEVRFRRMTAEGHYGIQNHTTKWKASGKHERDFTYMKPAYIAFTMVDEDDSLMWSPEDIYDDIPALGVEAVDELFDFACEVNPSPDSEEDVKEDLRGEPKDSSSGESRFHSGGQDVNF